MSKTLDHIKNIATPIVEEEGFVLVDVAFSKEFESKALVVTIDAPNKEGGVTVGDCRTVAKRINPILDEQDLVSGKYMFIVASPGVEDEKNGDN